MKKKVVSILLCASMIAVLGAAGCGDKDTNADANTDGSAKTEDTEKTSGKAEYTLTVHSHDPETSATGQFLNDWAASVEEASDGRLVIDVYHGAQLGGPKDTIDMINNGTCDIGWGLQSFFDGVFPVTEVFMLPCIDIERATQGSAAIWEFYNTTDYMEEEYANYHVLLLHTNCQSPITTTGKQLQSIDDLAGLQIRGNAGPPTTFIQNLGATPASCSINDLYQNLEKGAMDGCITDWHAISSFKLNELPNDPYFLDENIGVSTYFLLMNQSKYDKLPEDLQQILDEKSAEAIQYTTAWDDVEDAIKAAESDKLYNFDAGERAKLEEIAEETAQQWIEKMNGNGYDGQAIYDAAMKCIEEAK